METFNISATGTDSGTLHAPEYSPIRENEQVLLSLGINPDHIAALPMIVNTGDAFLLLEVRNSVILQSLQPEPDSVRLLTEQYHLSGYCIFSRDVPEQADATTRMIASHLDEPVEIPREAAAGALGCYLYDIAMIKKEDMVVLQGFFLSPPIPTRIHVHLELHDGKIVGLHTGIITPVQ